MQVWSLHHRPSTVWWNITDNSSSLSVQTLSFLTSTCKSVLGSNSPFKWEHWSHQPGRKKKHRQTAKAGILLDTGITPHSHAKHLHHTHTLHPSITLTCYTLPHTHMLHPSTTLTCYTLPSHSYATPVSLKQSLNRVVYTGYTFLSRTKSRQKKCSLYMLAIGFYNPVKGHLRWSNTGMSQ